MAYSGAEQTYHHPENIKIGWEKSHLKIPE